MKLYSVKVIAFLTYWIQPSIGAGWRAGSPPKMVALGLPFGDVSTSENLNYLKNSVISLNPGYYAPAKRSDLA